MEILKASETKYGEGFYLKALLMGGGGSGKTTAAGTFPGSLLLLDFDDGSEVMFGHPRVDIIRLKEPELARRWMEWDKIRKELTAQINRGSFPYDCIIADSLSMVYDMAMGYAMFVDSARGAGGVATSNHYAVEKRYGMEIIEWLLHIPVHAIATVHEYVDKDELTNQIYFFPTVRGKDGARLTRRFREIYHTIVRPGKGEDGKEVAEYFWRTSPEPQRPYLKSSLNTNSRYWGPIVGPNPSFESLLAKRGIKLNLKEKV
jgi:hypothetical protein